MRRKRNPFIDAFGNLRQLHGAPGGAGLGEQEYPTLEAANAASQALQAEAEGIANKKPMWGNSAMLEPARSTPDGTPAFPMIAVGPFPRPVGFRLEALVQGSPAQANAAQVEWLISLGIGDGGVTYNRTEMPRYLVGTSLSVNVRRLEATGAVPMQIACWCSLAPTPAWPCMVASEAVVMGVGTGTVNTNRPPFEATHVVVGSTANSGTVQYLVAMTAGGTQQVLTQTGTAMPGGIQPIPFAAATFRLTRTVTTAAETLTIFFMRG